MMRKYVHKYQISQISKVYYLLVNYMRKGAAGYYVNNNKTKP